MPNSVFSVLLYVFALFPGIAFTFAREGHRPTAKRSAFRETAAVVFVSAVCDVLIVTLLIIVSLFVPALNLALRAFLNNKSGFVVDNFQWVGPLVLAYLIAATALGWALGTKIIHDRGFKRLWDSSLVNRESSGWGVAFGLADENDKVLVGVQLKSGSWVQGYLHDFDNSGDAEPNRTIVLIGDLKFRPRGSDNPDSETVSGFATLVIEASEIEYLLVGYEESIELKRRSRRSEMGESVLARQNPSS